MGLNTPCPEGSHEGGRGCRGERAAQTQKSMRRFFSAHRDEDYSQIQYLTAKCTRLAHEKAVLDREFLVSRERERKLQYDLEASATRLRHQEQLNVELRVKQDQLIVRIHQQQDLVNRLQRRVVLLVEGSSRDGELLQQVGSELLCLQSSEVKMEGLVEELHAEAHHRAVVAESLRAELRRKTAELEELRDVRKTLTEELKDSKDAHQREVRELQQENEAGLKKLQEMVEQFEGLCQQQRYWMCCVKRFKVCLMEEREALLRQVSTLEKRTEKQKKGLRHDRHARDVLCHLKDPACSDSITPRDAEADLESQLGKPNTLFEELFNQAGGVMDGYQKPL